MIGAGQIFGGGGDQGCGSWWSFWYSQVAEEDSHPSWQPDAVAVRRCRWCSSSWSTPSCLLPALARPLGGNLPAHGPDRLRGLQATSFPPPATASFSSLISLSLIIPVFYYYFLLSCHYEALSSSSNRLLLLSHLSFPLTLSLSLIIPIFYCLANINTRKNNVILSQISKYVPDERIGPVVNYSICQLYTY